jgi:predicted DNA-binding transcriptional regulator AlpA
MSRSVEYVKQASRGDVIPSVKIGKLTRWNLEEVEHWIRNGCPYPGKANSEEVRSDG